MTVGPRRAGQNDKVIMTKQRISKKSQRNGKQESVNTHRVTFGTAYYPDHWPERDWAGDLDRICEAGVKAVRFGEFSWSWYEPSPGKFDFKAFDRFVKLVEERDLRLVLCTPTATPPPWFDRLYPGGRIQDMDGRRCVGVRHFWCWNHAASRDRAEKTIRRVAQQYRGSTALWGWQIDNEPNYAEEDHILAKSQMYDFNPAAAAAFIQWLKEKYGSIDALNGAWWSNFWSQRATTWDDVIPYRVAANPHAWLDFMRWREANIASFVHWQAAILRELTPKAKIGCNIPETGVRLSLSIGQDYWAQAKGLDWAGTDLYQATGDRKYDLARLAYNTDVMRSAANAGGAEFVLSETQAGPHERTWPQPFAGEVFGPDYLEQCARVYASRGAEQVWWFLWRPTHGGAEIGMNGMQALDGSDTARTVAARKLANPSSSIHGARAKWLKRKVAYIHYSRDSLRYASFWPVRINSMDDSLFGWHTLLEQAGFRVDFLDDASLVGAELDNETLLVLPQTSVACAAIVEKFSQTNARVFAGPYTAILNEHGQLGSTRLPSQLRDKWRVEFGQWHDVGKLPSATGLPVLTGFREMAPLAKANVKHRLSDRAPWCIAAGNAKVFGIEIGELFLRSSSAQRAALAKKVLA